MGCIEEFIARTIQQKGHLAFAKGWEKLAIDKWRMNEYQAVISALNHALAMDPTMARCWYLLGMISGVDSDLQQALAAYEKAIELRPDWQIGIDFLKCTRYLIYVYKDVEELQDCRQKIRESVAEFYQTFQSFSLDKKQYLSKWLGNVNTFLLPYQGKETRDVQQQYGQMIYEIMTSVIPAAKERPPMPPVKANEPLRIGFVSGHFRMHTVWKLLLHGWLKHLDKAQFQLYGYYVRDDGDRCTEQAKTYCHRFVMGTKSPAEWFEQIRADQLHLVIFPELGMDLELSKIAALKLAPIQCMSWGHPDTSGLPTIDYFLSSELMEPPDGETYYLEKLIRLKNLGIAFSPLPPDPRSPITREEFGLKSDAVIYGCLQSVFKYLPQFDDIYPEIAAAVGNCQFVFITHFMTKNSRQRFEGRLERAFAAKNLDYRAYCFFCRPLNFYGFTSMLHCLDVFLDSLEWSGGNSTLEALYYAQVPMVTTPGRFMRGRHTAGILTLLELPELIAPDVSAYIQKAIELGQSAEYRQFIREKIQNNLPKVFEDQAGVRSLEDFMRAAVQEFATSGRLL
ncbi:hypothetical protein RHJ80_03485 [Thermosynechococcus sp. QS41]|uniref:O-linked N-acetylglucosamine transferase, SPINDLY family protein n=2 Tax=Thermosynechococcus TaxID=146785 RepID=UPI0028775827|nr:hypothetical protein [Thermosynechococcus sp. QS41]WNC61022.1 hypothetical protein RHJ80_03485 [Thermosynechococcus sp. QS41]